SCARPAPPCAPPPSPTRRPSDLAVTGRCQQLNRAVSVEEVQDMVENQLMDVQAHDVARHYITYRYVQNLKRQTNTTDERILSLRSEEHTSELQSRFDLVCRLLLE